MKKSLFILGIVAILGLPACAEFTVDDTVDNTYLKNHGYSKGSIEISNKKRAEFSGEKYVKPAENELYQVPVVKYVRKFFMYIDPALDDHSFANDHEIHSAPSWYDL